MKPFTELAVPGIRKLHPYQPGKPIDELERELGISNIIKLASNENPLGPSKKALAAIEKELPELALYPDGSGHKLKQRLAQKLSLSPAQITLGNGSSEILELVLRVFAQAGDEVVFSAHAFALYPLLTQAIGATPVEVPAIDWGHDLDAMLAAITDKTRVLFVTNPNNPTGTWVARDALKTFIERVPEDVIIVMDEAYYEYASYLYPDDYPDAMQWLTAHPNLLVTRTFSKVYGLAGLRVGYGVCHPQMAELLNRLRPPFNVNSLALSAARHSLDDEEHLQASVEMNRAGMQQLEAGITQMGLDYIPSAGNFIAVDVGREGQGLFDALLREGVIVRPVANYAMPNFLRVTVGKPEENQRFLSSLQKVLS